MWVGRLEEARPNAPNLKWGKNRNGWKNMPKKKTMREERKSKRKKGLEIWTSAVGGVKPGKIRSSKITPIPPEKKRCLSKK